MQVNGAFHGIEKTHVIIAINVKCYVYIYNLDKLNLDKWRLGLDPRAVLPAI